MPPRSRSQHRATLEREWQRRPNAQSDPVRRFIGTRKKEELIRILIENQIQLVMAGQEGSIFVLLSREGGKVHFCVTGEGANPDRKMNFGAMNHMTLLPAEQERFRAVAAELLE